MSPISRERLFAMRIHSVLHLVQNVFCTDADLTFLPTGRLLLGDKNALKAFGALAGEHGECSLVQVSLFLYEKEYRLALKSAQAAGAGFFENVDFSAPVLEASYQTATAQGFRLYFGRVAAPKMKADVFVILEFDNPEEVEVRLKQSGAHTEICPVPDQSRPVNAWRIWMGRWESYLNVVLRRKET